MDLIKPLLCLEIDITDNISLPLDLMLPPATKGSAVVTTYELVVPSSSQGGIARGTCIVLKPNGTWPLKA